MSSNSLNLDNFLSALPNGHLRDGSSWLFSPEPFTLSKSETKKIHTLGHTLALFQRASDEIYRLSADGRLPSWISLLLDAGKPKWMIEVQRSKELREAMPRVIRPDLMLKEDGFGITELDSVPGGIGITAWLSLLYERAGTSVIAGKEGMIHGFQSLMPEGGRVLISEESVDYKPEMAWLSSMLKNVRVENAEEAELSAETSYRFFEWFDWKNIKNAKSLSKSKYLTSPCKPHLEDKLWLTLFWSPALRELWKGKLRHSHLEKLKKLIPYGWILDNEKLPPHAAIPRLEVQSWGEVAEFSQKQRQLVLKISGYHETAWGSRGVVIGHDVDQLTWRNAINHAVAQQSVQPWVLQEFSHARIVEHPYFDPLTGEVKIMRGRVRLCPYYFVDANKSTKLGGVLATIVKADKKKLHGMSDAILTVCKTVQ